MALNSDALAVVRAFTPPRPQEIQVVDAVVVRGGAGGLVVNVAGAEIKVTRTSSAGFIDDLAAGLVVPGARVELARVRGVYRVRGLIQEF